MCLNNSGNSIFYYQVKMSERRNMTEHLSKVSLCCLNIIVKDYSKYKHFHSDSKINDSLTKYCKEILMYSMLTPSSTLNLSRNKLANLYGISYLIVQKINIQNSASSGVVRRSTKIIVKAVHSLDYYTFSIEAEKSPQLAGLTDQMRKILQLVQLNRISTSFPHRPLGVIISGPPGCGKTSLAKKIAQASNAILLKVDVSDVLTSELGEGPESLKKLFEKAFTLVEEGPIILFFDEIDMLCPRPDNASMGSQQLASAFLCEIDNLQTKEIPGVFMVATTNVISSVDPIFRRPGRFDQEVLISVPNQLQRTSILEILTSNMHLTSEVSCQELAKRTPGFVGADLRQLCEEALNQASSAALNRENEDLNVQVSLSYFETALHKVIPSLKKSTECVVDLQPVQWADIGGLDDVKEEIKQCVEWPLLFPEALQAMDISPTKGLLLYGPPGCCKTTLVKAAASACHVSFLSLNGAQVYSPYVGESERIISEAFQKARALAPSLLFFDEIESLVGKRKSGGGQSRVQERILSTLLNEVDGVGMRLDSKIGGSPMMKYENENEKSRILESGTVDDEIQMEMPAKSPSLVGVMLVGATNRPDMLDPAILRPGRLDRHIYVPPPDLEAREAILKIYTNKMPCQSDLDLTNLGLKTELYTGADLKNLCKEAGLEALRDQTLSRISSSSITVEEKHFIQALKTVRASLTQESLNHYVKKK